MKRQPLLAPAALGVVRAEACDRQAFADTMAHVRIEPLKLPREQVLTRLAGEHEALGRSVREERISGD